MATYFPGQQYDPMGLALGQGLGGGLSNFAGNFLMNQDIQKLQNWSGSGEFPNLMTPMGQQAALQNMLGAFYGKPPWWVQGATPTQIEDYRNRVGGPLVQMGEKLLPAEDRIRGAQADLDRKLTQKPLTPTEQKGVQATIKDILGEGKALPFGLKLGPAYTQEDMGTKWENAMEATGYEGRNEVQKSQIRNEFDRSIAILNKGKGPGVLKGQYQWNRRKYKSVDNNEFQTNIQNARKAIYEQNKDPKVVMNLLLRQYPSRKAEIIKTLFTSQR